MLNFVDYFNRYKKNSELIFLFTILAFSVLTRILPYSVIALVFLGIFIFASFQYFYFYTNNIAIQSNKNQTTEEFSWGFIRETKNHLDLKSMYKFLLEQDINFYKTFLVNFRNEIVLFVFIFGDFIVAFKNLSLSESGIYFALSIFCKFIFIAYIYISKSYDVIDITDENRDSKILDIFYKHLNGMLSLSLVFFVLMFILSRFVVEIFFGEGYMLYHTSLPFVLLANLSLLVALFIYKTAKILDKAMTVNILKIFIPIFTVLFIFLTHNYIDTVTYFVIAGCSILSIFLYNFVIRKPAYIESTYNHLF